MSKQKLTFNTQKTFFIHPLFLFYSIIASFPFSSCEINSPKRGDENNVSGEGN